MPVSNSPDKRVRILDQLLSKKYHSPENCNIDEYLGCWTKEELAIAVSSELDLEKVISEKTIENDLKKMADFYGAPIDSKTITLPYFNQNLNDSLEDKSVKRKLVNSVNKTGFFYWDYTRNIFNNNNLSTEEFKSLRSVIDILKQFKGLNNFEDVESLIDKLELKAFKTKNPQIFFDTVDTYSGLDHVSFIATSIKEEKVLKIKYQPFYESDPENYTIHPYQLREFNNRWFVLAYTEEFEERKLGVYGLSRIIDEPDISNNPYKKPDQNKVVRYFKDIIGVTNFETNPVEKITFKVFGVRSSYINTKPWHSSQKRIEENESFSVFSINVKQNNELIAKILEFGKDIEVISPLSLREQVKLNLKEATERYT